MVGRARRKKVALEVQVGDGSHARISFAPVIKIKYLNESELGTVAVT